MAFDHAAERRSQHKSRLNKFDHPPASTYPFFQRRRKRGEGRAVVKWARDTYGRRWRERAS